MSKDTKLWKTVNRAVNNPTAKQQHVSIRNGGRWILISSQAERSEDLSTGTSPAPIWPSGCVAQRKTRTLNAVANEKPDRKLEADHDNFKLRVSVSEVGLAGGNT